MSETTEPVPAGSSTDSTETGSTETGHTEGTVPGGPPHRENVSTRPMRTVGQRRHDAEEKLARHLEQARHPAATKHPPEPPGADQ